MTLIIDRAAEDAIFAELEALGRPLTLISEERGERRHRRRRRPGAGGDRPDRRLAERQARHALLRALDRGGGGPTHGRRRLRLRARPRQRRGVVGRARRRRLPGRRAACGCDPDAAARDAGRSRRRRPAARLAAPRPSPRPAPRAYGRSGRWPSRCAGSRPGGSTRCHACAPSARSTLAAGAADRARGGRRGAFPDGGAEPSAPGSTSTCARVWPGRPRPSCSSVWPRLAPRPFGYARGDMARLRKSRLLWPGHPPPTARQGFRVPGRRRPQGERGRGARAHLRARRSRRRGRRSGSARTRWATCRPRASTPADASSTSTTRNGASGRTRRSSTTMIEFARSLPAMRERVAVDIEGDELTRERVLACAVRLLERGFFRDRHRGLRRGERELRPRDDAQGARHARPGGRLAFDYPAKSGKRQVVSVVDPASYEIVAALKRRRGGSEELLACKRGRALARREVGRHQRLREGDHGRRLLGQGLPHLERHACWRRWRWRSRKRPRPTKTAASGRRRAR